MGKNEEIGIRLRRKDINDKILCKCVDALIALVNDDVLAFDALINIIQVSAYWSLKVFSDRYEKWKQDSKDYKRLPNEKRDAIDVKLRDCFCEADSVDGWAKLRGMFAERIVERAFLKWYKENARGFIPWEYETGCAVYVNGRLIKYTCAESEMQRERCRQISQSCLPNGSCKGDRETVDIGTTTLIGGNREISACFVETKLMPRGFHFLDGEYLAYLKKSMDKEQVGCQVVVASLSECTMIKNRVDLCLGDGGDYIEIWGIDKIRKLIYG
jgi:hypothetical protein